MKVYLKLLNDKASEIVKIDLIEVIDDITS